MSYTKNTWVDQDVERPKTYEVTNNQDGSITLTDSFGLVQELGTPVNAVNMNHIEDGIDGCAIRKHNLTETFNLGEWVLGGSGDDEGFYKSLIANNVGNAVTDNTAWQKADLVDISSRADVDFSNVTDTGYIKMAGASLPSDTYIDLTLGARGATYTAPADGYFYIDKSGNNGTYVGFINFGINNTYKYATTIPIYNTNGVALLPVKKNDKITVNYNATGTTNAFRFIYAQGSESEAS